MAAGPGVRRRRRRLRHQRVFPLLLKNSARAALVLTAGLLFAFLAFPASAPAASPSLKTLEHNGRERTYHVHPPDNMTGEKLPLVVVLHGANGNAEQMEYMTGMSDKAEKERFIAVYPEGTGRGPERKYTWNAGNCCGGALEDNVDDVGFIRAVIAAVLRDYPADPERVFVTGFSNGAMLAYKLGCEASDMIAAIAPVAGALEEEYCYPADQVSVIAFHGTGDGKILYSGGVSREPGVPRNYDQPVSYTIRFWANHNGGRLMEEGFFDNSAAVIRRRYKNLRSGTEVVLFTLNGAGHSWPYRESGVDATDEIWNFFKTRKKI